MKLCRDLVNAVERELDRWGTVKYRAEEGRTHNRLVLVTESAERFVTVSKSSGDRRALLNSLSDVRRTLRTMGLERRN